MNRGSIVGVRHEYISAYTNGADTQGGNAILIENNPTATIVIVNEGDIFAAGGRGGAGGDGGTAVATDGSTLAGGSHTDQFGTDATGGPGAGYRALNDSGFSAYQATGIPGKSTTVLGEVDPQNSAIKGGSTGANGAGGGFGESGSAGSQGNPGVSPYGFTQGSAGQSGGSPGKAIKDDSNGATIILSNRGTIKGVTEGVS